MRLSAARWIIAAVLSAVVVSSNLTAHADSPEFVSATEFEELKQRFDEYERRLNAAEYRPAPRTFCHPCSTQPGLTFNAEVTFLKPYQSEGESPGFDHEAAPRVSMGYTGNEGLGVRVRWFDYETVNPANIGVPALIEKFDLDVVDVEVTDKFRLGHWDGLLSGGLRYADYEEFGFFDADRMNDSLGPVIGVELSRNVNSKLQLFGLARASLQFAGDGVDNGRPMSNMFFSISEIQIGAERTLREVRGGRVFIRGAFEAQRWSGGVIGDGDSEDLGLIGGTVAIGIAR